MHWVRNARDEHFDRSGFSEADYDAAWVVLRIGPVPVFAFPNSAGRRRAVPLHDLHHVATGYSTSLVGEAQISAWELGAGCGDFGFARWIGVAGALMGVAIAPRKTRAAYLRGKRSTTLYKRPPASDPLEWTVEELRRHLGLQPPISEDSCRSRTDPR